MKDHSVSDIAATDLVNRYYFLDDSSHHIIYIFDLTREIYVLSCVT